MARQHSRRYGTREQVRQLSLDQLDYTVAIFFRTSHTNAPRVEAIEYLDPNVQATENLDIALRIVPFGRVALLRATEFLVAGTFGHVGALLAAAWEATNHQGFARTHCG